MNITTNFQNVSLVTTNPATDRVVQDNAARSVIPATEPVHPSLKEQPVAAQRDKTSPKVNATVNPTYDLPSNATPEEIASVSEQERDDEQSQEQHRGASDSARGEQDSSDKPEQEEKYSTTEQQKINELEQRHSEVITHEMAHATVGGQYSGAPNYSYETGPDGSKYAVAGEVSIDTSRVPNDPQATLRKAQQIKAAALAPAQPSSQDRRVAMKADSMAAQARQEILAQGRDDQLSTGYRPNHQIESDSFNRRIALSQNENFQATLKTRSSHIGAFYQQSHQSSASSTFSRQV